MLQSKIHACVGFDEEENEIMEMLERYLKKDFLYIYEMVHLRKMKYKEKEANEPS